MAKKEDYDVVIIGSGVSGLVAGCYLQKAGLKVAILEAREEAGGGRMAHEAMRPGFPVQSCVWAEMDYVMMHQLNLELDRYGYQEYEMTSDWGVGFAFEDGTCLVNNAWDYRKTAEKVGRFSEKDARKILEMGEYMAGPFDDKTSRGVRFTELICAEPWTWENFDVLVNLLAPILPFDDPYEVTDLNTFELVDLMFGSDQLKVLIAHACCGGGIFPFHTGGGSSIGALLSMGMFYSHPRLTCHTTAHSYIRCFRTQGGKLFNSCPVEKIIIAGGEAKGVVLDKNAAFPGKEITAKKVVSNLNPRVTFTHLVGEEHVGKRVIQQLKTNWKAEAPLLFINYALKEKPRFAAEKFDPDMEYIMAGGMGAQKLEDVMNHYGQRAAGRIPKKIVQGFAGPHKNDPTPVVVNSGWDVPYAIYEKGGAEIWDDRDFRREMLERAIDIWEAHAPGFKKSLIDYWITTPLDLARLNPNYIRGCQFGGATAAPQMWYGNRPGADGFAKGGVVTPIKNLYISGSVGFTNTTGGNGYRAACHIAEELGIRNQPWWTHRVYEYVTKKFIEKTYVPLKPTSVLDR